MIRFGALHYLEMAALNKPEQDVLIEKAKECHPYEGRFVGYSQGVPGVADHVVISTKEPASDPTFVPHTQSMVNLMLWMLGVKDKVAYQLFVKPEHQVTVSGADARIAYAPWLNYSQPYGYDKATGALKESVN